VWLLHCVRVSPKQLSVTRWLAAGLISVVMLTVYSLQTLRNREEDFSRRLPTPSNGYRYANPVAVASGVAYTEMQPSRYGVALASNGATSEIPVSGDALSLAGSLSGTLLYSEVTARQSVLVRLPIDQLGSVPQLVTQGQEPALSSNGKWLAFIREVQGRRTVWLRELESHDAPQTALVSAYQPLDLTVTDDGDVIAAAGNVSDPQLLRILRNTREVIPLAGFTRPTRYPSISPDGRRLAFTRREHGVWHLFVRDLATTSERQLTHAWCNALSPSWMDTHTVLYATDCGRGVGLTAIARVVVPE
jgi:WD40-like Beta Propeller Repeat